MIRRGMQGDEGGAEMDRYLLERKNEEGNEGEGCVKMSMLRQVKNRKKDDEKSRNDRKKSKRGKEIEMRINRRLKSI